MFGQFKPVTFDPYGRRRSGLRVPRWLVLVLGGAVIGAGGVVLVQERYMPPRLSADASTKLQTAYEVADTARMQSRADLGEVSKQLQTSLAEKKELSDQLASSRAAEERLHDDLASMASSLPPDPRGGAVELRAGRFGVKAGQLTYDMILTREHAESKPIAASAQFVIAGTSARGVETSVTTKAIPVSVGSLEVVRGTVPIPDGFQPRQVTAQLLAGGKLLGMRVFLTK